MTVGDIGTQYATGLSRQGIERALTAAGKDTDHLAPADLGALEDFHTMGRIATGQLAELAGIASQDRVLDAGAGIGGTARYLAATHGCQVTAVDLTGDAVTLMQAVLARPPAPLGLHAFVPDFTAKATNLTQGLAAGRLRAIQAVAVAA